MITAPNDPVAVRQTQFLCLSWDELRDRVLAFTEWSGFGGFTAYQESYEACRFVRTSEDWRPDAMSFEGRVFGDQGEARWVTLEDGRFNVWCIREADGAESCPARKRMQRYYLLGKGTEEKNQFWEARYPLPFKFPIEDGAAALDRPQDVRAFVEVAEYRRVEPAWNQVAPDSLSQILDQPMLFAHRFVRLASGMDDTLWGNHE